MTFHFDGSEVHGQDFPLNAQEHLHLHHRDRDVTRPVRAGLFHTAAGNINIVSDTRPTSRHTLRQYLLCATLTNG
jgi:hypothetical protein